MRTNERVEIKPTTAEDLAVFYGESLPFTIRSLSFFLDGELAALGGVRYERGYFIAFSDIKPGVTVSKATIYRCGLEVMKFIKKLNIPVIALANTELESAPRFLSHLGFDHLRSDPHGEIYQWHR